MLPQSSYSFKGLQTAHALGMSWKSIILIVVGMLLFFGLGTFLMFKNAQKNTSIMNQNIEKNIQEATAAAEKQRLETEANIQKQINEAIRQK